MRSVFLFLVCSICCTSCREIAKKLASVKGNSYEANIEILPPSGVSFTSQTSLFRKRVMSAYVLDGEEVLGGGKEYHLQVNGVEDSNCLKLLLLSKGQLAIRHAFEYSELKDYISAIQQLSVQDNKQKNNIPDYSSNGLLTENEIIQKLAQENQSVEMANSLFVYLIPPFDPWEAPTEGAICGYSLKKDTSTIIQILDTYRAKVYLPESLKWHWGIVSSSDTIFALYGIKIDHYTSEPILTNSQVEEAWADEQKQEGGKLYTVVMILNGAGSSALHRATSEAANAIVRGKRIHKSLAVLLDNKVYSSSRVMQEITGGKLGISGLRSYEEAKVLSAIIANEPISAEVNLAELRKK